MPPQRRIRQTQTLFDFSRKLSGTAGLDDILWAVASQTAGAVKGAKHRAACQRR